MQNDLLSQSLHLETSLTNKNLYIAYKKLTKRNGITPYLPVAEILINSGSEPFVSFYKAPTLSDEEKDFIITKSKELAPEKLSSD